MQIQSGTKIVQSHFRSQTPLKARQVMRTFANQAKGAQQRLNYEEVYIKDYVSPREAREGLRAYLRFYNEHRLHQALDYRTRAEVYFEN